MENVAKVKATVKAALDQAARCAASETSENYDALDALAQTLDEQAREALQSQLDVASLLSKLKQQKPLTPGDLKTLELLIVGDSESFLKYETDLPQWKEEVHRLVNEMNTLASAPTDVDGLLHLRALGQELRRVLPDIVYYLDDKERVERFRKATSGPLDAEGYSVLAEIVSAMISSDKV
jgi:hypothetical protein